MSCISYSLHTSGGGGRNHSGWAPVAWDLKKTKLCQQDRWQVVSPSVDFFSKGNPKKVTRFILFLMSFSISLELSYSVFPSTHSKLLSFSEKGCFHICSIIMPSLSAPDDRAVMFAGCPSICPQIRIWLGTIAQVIGFVRQGHSKVKCLVIFYNSFWPIWNTVPF